MSTARARQPVVIKVGGTTIEEPGPRRVLCASVADVHRAAPVVLVHGGGKAVDRHLERLGMVTERREGIRVTPPDQLDEIVAVLAGRINKSVVGALSALGVCAVGLCLGDGGAGADGGGVETRATTRYAFDPGRVGDVTGDVRGGGARLLRTLAREGYLSVVSSIGIDAAGEFLNVNADDAAAGVAAAVGASALVLVTDVEGILDGRRRVVPELDAAGVEGMIASGEIGGGMIVKARAAVGASRAAGAPVVILSGMDPLALGRWARGEAVGTRIVAAGRAGG